MGKHSKEKESSLRNRIATAVALSVAGGAGGIAFAPVAQAAPVSAWDRIAECESNQRWNLPYGHASSTGGLQIQKPTWDEYGGRAYAAWPYQTTKENQIRIAEKILKGQGPGAWVCNAKVGYPLSGANRNVNPFPVTPAPKPTPKPESKPDTGRPESTTPHDHYKVVKGDTLYDIAKSKKVKSWQELYRWNTKIVENPNLIYPGEVLNVPRGVASAPAPSAPAKPAPAAKYVKPVNAGVSQAYGNPNSGYALGYHTGTDFRTNPPAEGATIVATSAGVVVASDTSGAYGINVQIKHDNGKYTLSAHLRSKSVGVGQKVVAGQKIGELGSTPHGRFNFPHLHFEVRNQPYFQSGGFLNPVDYLRSHGVVL